MRNGKRSGASTVQDTAKNHLVTSSSAQDSDSPAHPTALANLTPIDRSQNRVTELKEHTRAPLLRSAQSRKFNAQSDNGSESILELQQAHLTLSQRLDEVCAELARTEKGLVSELARRNLSNETNESRAMNRAVMFASISAKKALETTNKHFSASPRHICAANSIVELLIRSQRSDCSLYEFQRIAAMASSSGSIHCTVLPSTFYALHSDTQQISRLDIVFRSYSDLCDVLKISPRTRESGVYQQKTNRRKEVRAVMVLGVVIEQQGASSSPTVPDAPRTRRVILGGSKPTPPGDDPVPMLFQCTTRWSSPTWESGFTLRRESTSTAMRNIVERELEKEPENQFTSDFNRNPWERRSFALSWERSKDSTYPSNSSADMIPGYLRSYFPAVVLRTSKLIATTDRIFKTRLQPENMFLKQILSTSK